MWILGLKGLQNFSDSDPHLAGNTCNSIGGKRRKNICTQRLCAVRQRRSSEFDSFYIHPLPCFIHFFKKISVVKKITAASRLGFEPARGNPIGFQVQRLNHSAIAAPIRC